MDTWSEEFRHQCLVRYVIQLRRKNRKDAVVFLENWNTKHKDKRLEEDVRKQWFRGNRGQHNDWRLI